MIVGVRFERAGRIYYYDSAGIELNIGDWVVVETEKGVRGGWVVIAPNQVLVSELQEPLAPILRRAEAEDLTQLEELKAGEREALAQCAAKVAERNLAMKLVSAEYNLDGSRLTVFFTAEERVDFRDLVRDLAATLKTRVELRQIGPRDEAKLRGGYGRCGRPLCCSTYLCTFSPVSIRMAKEQDLPLNPMKISGLCGRLLCCLAYENEQYCLLRERMPRLGEKVETPEGPGKVVASSLLKERVSVLLENETTLDLPLAEVRREEGETGREKTKRRRGRRK